MSELHIAFLKKTAIKVNSVQIKLDHLKKQKHDADTASKLEQIDADLATVSASIRSLAAAMEDPHKQETSIVQQAVKQEHIPNSGTSQRTTEAFKELENVLSDTIKTQSAGSVKLEADMFSRQSLARMMPKQEQIKESDKVLDYYAKLFHLTGFLKAIKEGVDPISVYLRNTVLRSLEDAFDVGIGNPYRLIIQTLYTEKQIAKGVIHESKVTPPSLNPEDKDHGIGLYGRRMTREEDASHFVYDFMIIRTARFVICIGFYDDLYKDPPPITVTPAHVPFYAWKDVMDLPGNILNDIEVDLKNYNKT